jgi:hypothetical protein
MHALVVVNDRGCSVVGTAMLSNFIDNITKYARITPSVRALITLHNSRQKSLHELLSSGNSDDACAIRRYVPNTLYPREAMMCERGCVMLIARGTPYVYEAVLANELLRHEVEKYGMRKLYYIIVAEGNAALINHIETINGGRSILELIQTIFNSILNTGALWDANVMELLKLHVRDVALGRRGICHFDRVNLFQMAMRNIFKDTTHNDYIRVMMNMKWHRP